MPIQYEGIVAETLHTRLKTSIFDICHMGEFFIQGQTANAGLEDLLSCRVATIPMGSCRYSSILNETAGIMDDLIIYRRGPSSWLIVVNAGTIDKDEYHFLKNLSSGTDFTNASALLGKIDLQGPLSRDIIIPLCPAAKDLAYYTFLETKIFGEESIVSRTGYTGELGYEIYAPNSVIPAIWEKLLSDPRVKPAGLGARDILRLEMGYSLYGQDVDDTITPVEAGLEKFLDLNKEFLGRCALLTRWQKGFARRRVYLRTASRRSPRHGHAIFQNGHAVGEITSGTFSPHLNCGIGMGFITTAFSTEDSCIQIGDDSLKIDAIITDKPFVKNTSLKD
jgi:aminomethyltransferase